MKFVSFKYEGSDRLGLCVDEKIYDLYAQAQKINACTPKTMAEFLNCHDQCMEDVQKIHDDILANPSSYTPVESPELLSPVPHPTSVRDGYAFRQHVQTMRANRGAEMAPEFDQFPIFYFSNHNATFGGGDVLLEKDHFEKMDFELEISVVIGKRGINIKAEEADDYIFGYMIWNDLSARRMQLEEMKLSLGPAKGKDFGNTFGPYLVTRDALKHKRIETPEGEKYSLRMTAKHNGKLISDGNAETMNWSFAQIIERASYGAELLPGDIIGSGTVGTGCLAEINGTGNRKAQAAGDTYTPTWLEPGDTIELEIEELGVLTNTLKLRNPDYSILAKKKNV